MSDDIKLAYGFFCEDIREEIYGKTSAMGMWGHTCRIYGSPPGALSRLALHCHVLNPKQHPFTFEIDVHVPGMPGPVIKVQGESKPPSDGKATAANLNLTLGGGMIPAPGLLRADIKIRYGDQTYETQVAMNVEFDPSGPPPR